MIVREENYDGFKNFDFFNDAKDTIGWLRRVGRNEEANDLQSKFDNWLQRKNFRTHTLLKPSECKCTGVRSCPICDGGLAFCTVCKGGEVELEEKSCEERLNQKKEEDEAERNRSKTH